MREWLGGHLPAGQGQLISSTVVSPMAARESLLSCLHYPLPYIFSDLSAHRPVSHTCVFLTPHKSQTAFGAFFTYISPEAAPSWLRGSVVPCAGSIGSSSVQHGAATASPHRGHPAVPHCHHLDTNMQDAW